MEENVVQEAKHEGAPTVNRSRHEAQCSICASPYRQEIEEAFINWQDISYTAREYNTTRDAIYRHAHACNLFSKRRRNVIMALDQIIELADRHLSSCSASGVVSAVQLSAKLSKEEEAEKAKVQAVRSPNLLELLGKMEQAERDAFARDGSLPEWLLRAIGATPRVQ